MNKLKSDLGEENVKLTLARKVRSDKKKEKSDPDQQPLFYEGQLINTLEELRDLVKIKTFEEAVVGEVRKIRNKETS